VLALERVAAVRSRALVVFLSCAAQFMVVLDVSVVNVALPTIRAALGFDAAGVQWVVNGYGLAFACFLLLGGRLADLHGLRTAVVGGLAVFGTASLVGGLAASAGVLVGARVVQGLGAAALAPATLTLLTATFPEGPRRVRAIAWWTAVGLAGGTGGNLLGGAITEFASWRWVLLVNVPLCAVAVVVALTRLSGERARPARAPLFPLRLLAVRTVSVGNALVALAAACLVPMWFFMAFLMQDGLGYAPLRTGLGFLPHTLVTMVVGTWVAPRLMARWDARVVIATGAAVAALGFGWQGLNAVRLDGGYVEEILGPALLMSAGGGLLNTPITTTVTSGVPRADAGAASGLMNTAKQLGGAAGLAVLVAAASGGAALDYDLAFLTMAIILCAVGLGAWILPRPDVWHHAGRGPEPAARRTR
jgi:predicted MFS family arabinose efflux permease